MKFVYYSFTIRETPMLHFWYHGQYFAYDYISDKATFCDKLNWLIHDRAFYKISYRGNHVEKPMIVLMISMLENDISDKILCQKIFALSHSLGSPTKRLATVFNSFNLKVDFYSSYLKLLTHPLMLDIETFDGRIYHNSFNRLEVQALLDPAKNQKAYLANLEIIFQNHAFQEVFQQKHFLLKNFRGHFHFSVNESTTDAQLTESFYTKTKLKDAYAVFIPQKYLPLTYLLNGDLRKLYDCYHSNNPKRLIKKRFGKNGAITLLPHFIISSGASAPIGFQIENYTPKKSWTSQVRTKRFDKAIRLDLTHVQSYIMLEAVKDTYFRQQLAKVLRRWKNEPENRLAFNRLLYPIQGSMDTPFDHDLHTPNYAYSMRIVHNLLLIDFFKKVIQIGMSPISLNNEVIFLELNHFNQDYFEECLRILGIYFDYRFIENLIIKDTNNYTYFDTKTKNYVFKGASFNHYQGTDVISSMEKPPIVDWVLHKMIIDIGDFDENFIFHYLQLFLKENSLEKIKEYFMILIRPLKKRFQYLFKNNEYQEVLSANAFFVSTGKDTWQYRQFFEKNNRSLYERPAILEEYHVNTSKKLQEVEHSRLHLEKLDKLQVEHLDLFYYASLINLEINLWK